MNLMTNAVKYNESEKTRIEITFQLYHRRLHIRFEDNGIGIAEEDTKRIFGMFERAGSGEDQPGNGMGLAICKRIVQNHGGNIWVRSSPGSGSVFIFSVLQPDDSAEALD